MKSWLFAVLLLIFISGCGVGSSNNQKSDKYSAILKAYDIDNQSLKLNATYEIYLNDKEVPIFFSAGNITDKYFTQVSFFNEGNYTIKAFSSEYYRGHKSFLIKKEQLNNINSNEVISIYLRKKANLGDYSIIGNFEDLQLNVKNINAGYYDNLNYCITWSHNIARVYVKDFPKNIKVEKTSIPPKFSSKVDECYATNMSINKYDLIRTFNIHIDKFGVFNDKDNFMFWLYDNPSRNQGVKLDATDFIYTITFSEIEKVWKRNIIQTD